MTYPHILFSLESGIALITLNRPDRLNSFNVDMHMELREAIARTRDGGARVLLLTGAGGGFCAGQDLADRNVSADAAPVDLGFTIETYYRPLILSLRSLVMPVICAVNGVAAGAGASIALHSAGALGSGACRPCPYKEEFPTTNARGNQRRAPYTECMNSNGIPEGARAPTAVGSDLARESTYR